MFLKNGLRSLLICCNKFTPSQELRLAQLQGYSQITKGKI